MSNIETLQAQRQALEKQISEQRATAIAECQKIMQAFNIKSWELTGGKRPGRPSNTSQTVTETVSSEGQQSESTVQESTETQTQSEVTVSSKGKKAKKGQTPAGEAAVV